MKLNRSDEEAVSPVIGVILMVAIVVILAAVVAAFVFGMVGSTSSSKTVGTSVSLNSANTKTIDVMFIGGADLPNLVSFTVNQNGAKVTVTTATTGYTATNGEIKPSGTPAIFKVGDVIAVASLTNDASGSRITLIGRFKDGSTQIIYDKNL
jgi:archaeal type IV pilus assembly protein PilA